MKKYRYYKREDYSDVDFNEEVRSILSSLKDLNKIFEDIHEDDENRKVVCLPINKAKLKRKLVSFRALTKEFEDMVGLKIC